MKLDKFYKEPNIAGRKRLGNENAVFEKGSTACRMVRYIKNDFKRFREEWCREENLEHFISTERQCC